MTHAAFPGSFDPLTIAHLAIVDAVRAQRDAVWVDLVISQQALDKEGRAHEPVPDRVATIETHRSTRPWVRPLVTEEQLLVDIARGYDLLVVGADKWHQLHDPRYYGDSRHARDAALDRLPDLAIVPRSDVRLPRSVANQVLELPEQFLDVSSTAVRDGRDDWRA
ncbi:hypothetical protein [Actinospongicola halichondriae]|uniref:hypothetical protein n=1 Tax=Actinospongicola halichondriae TaxID=3236844 RepID=UPI003D5AA610